MKTEERSAALTNATICEPIAIVGMSCRFPHAETLTAFWELLSKGRDTIAPIPASRWDHAAYYDPDPAAPHKTNQRHASMLDNIHDFDPFFFGISPAEASEMSPSQKLMLELVWEAIENSCMPFDGVKGKKAGVYIGNIWNDFEHYRKHANARVSSHSAIGQSANIIANRISFSYGFTGPSLVVDTGCSSSLVALHLACQALWDGSTELSVVGAVNHILDPDQYILLSKFGGLSPSGKCHTFDSHADGFVRGEGGGVVLLKTLTEAEKNGDKIYALIRGTAMNNNGFNVNLPATSVMGQKQVLADAYAKSGIAPETVHYVEAHGTGTRLGDPTETQALGEFFCSQRKHGALHIGSVKTNLGHLEGAAGMAGLIKVALAMNHRTIPPSLNFFTPNPKIAFDRLRLNVQQLPGDWPVQNDETLKAGINSFGWGGTNAHTVLEEYRAQKKEYRRPQPERYCLPLSAKSSTALKEYARAYAARVRGASPDELANICVATALTKPSFNCRAFFTAHNQEQLAAALTEFAAAQDTPNDRHHQFTGNEKIVMVFPGQGAQWHGMGKDLYEREPVFKRAIDRCDEAFKPYTNWSLINELKATPEASRLGDIDVVQPMLFAIQIALAELWISWGIQPDAVVGHSMGEVAAAYTAGAIGLDDASAVICNRSKLMRTLRGKGGAMAMTELSIEEAQLWLHDFPDCAVAAQNSPKATVLSGHEHSIDRILLQLVNKGLFCRRVNVDVASHSPQMESLKEDLYRRLQSVSPQSSHIPFFSTVTGSLLEGEALNAAYWVKNLRQRVCFAQAIDNLMQGHHTIFVEVSPHPILAGAINDCAAQAEKKVTVAGSLHRDLGGYEAMLKNLGEMFQSGQAIPWSTFYKTSVAPHVTLPSYPFQRSRYELERRTAPSTTKTKRNTFPLAGTPLELAGNSDATYWETDLSLDDFPFLTDHQVNDLCIVPGAAYIEMVLEVARERHPQTASSITDLRFVKSITLLPESKTTVQLKLVSNGLVSDFTLYEKEVTASKGTTWNMIASGSLSTQPGEIPMRTPGDFDDAPVAFTGEAYYESLKTLGLQYGRYFQGIGTIRKSRHSPSQISFTIKACEHIVRSTGQYRIHPALLDACLQPVFFSMPERLTAAASATSLLTNIDEIQLLAPIPYEQDLQGIAILHPALEKEGVTTVGADIVIFSHEGQPLLALKGVHGKTIDTTGHEQRNDWLRSWLTSIMWEQLIDAGKLQTIAPEGRWIILGDGTGTSHSLFEKMSLRGFDCVHVMPGVAYNAGVRNYTMNYNRKEEYGKLITEHSREVKIQGIIHMAGAGNLRSDILPTAEEMENLQHHGSVSLLHLYQALEEQQVRPALFVVTRAVMPVSPEDNVQPAHSPLAGLVRVMFNEATEYPLWHFDLAERFPASGMDHVLERILTANSAEKEIAFRDRCYVPRLKSPAIEGLKEAKDDEFSADKVYVVTGYRGIAFSFLEWMSGKGARNFALISRSENTSPQIKERIDRLTAGGCTIAVFNADVGNYEELKSVFEKIELKNPIGGVVHAAGVIKANTLAETTANEFFGILNPKLKGAWNLHRLTKNKALDCFILFSSAASLIGLSGQGSYVAANAFLDALTHHRRALGLSGMSINWGVIADTGMVADIPELARYAREEGFRLVAMNDALGIVTKIYGSAYRQVGVLQFDAAAMSEYYSRLAQTNYFKGLLGNNDLNPSRKTQRIDHQFAARDEREKKQILESIVLNDVAAIIRTSAAQIKPSMTFKELGIDSIMAVQLRNGLEKKLGLKLSVGMFWAHPSLLEFVQFLMQQFSIAPLKVATGKEDKVRWFSISRPNPTATFRVFLFHDAGGETGLFNGWESLLGKEAEIVAIELPGRGRRASERMPGTIDELIESLKPALRTMTEKPYAFFGQSLGGLLAFETARSLQQETLNGPTVIFLSSVPAPDTFSPQDIDFEALGKDLIMDRKLDSELRGKMLRLLKQDLELLATYQYAPHEKLHVPLVVIYGEDDPRVTKTQAEHWQHHTASSATVIARPGGHRYIDEDSRFLTDLIKKEFSIQEQIQQAIMLDADPLEMK